VTPRREDEDYLRDMLEAAEKVAAFIRGMTREMFLTDEKTQFAVVRGLEIIGEAAKMLPGDIKSEHSAIPWREISGMRDKLVHDYFGANAAVVWKTAIDELPRIAQALRRIIT
jgi:uncharacterized protein with HEPN domain